MLLRNLVFVEWFFVVNDVNCSVCVRVVVGWMGGKYFGFVIEFGWVECVGEYEFVVCVD